MKIATAHTDHEMRLKGFKAWVHSARPRTLPLAFSSSLTGSFIALHDGLFKWNVFGLALLTTLFLQVLSNFANDYGDAVNGADNHERIGPARSVQSGFISAESMKFAVKLTAFMALVSGILLIGAGIGYSRVIPWIVFLGIGLLAIVSAVLYTAGPNPYGYRGFGDLFVFLFFGLTGVAGTYYLHTGLLNLQAFLPAISMGFMSTAVLNVNNMRDVEGDTRSGKRTVVVLLGFQRARRYHFFLITGALAALLVWTWLHYTGITQLIYLLAFPLFILHLRAVARCSVPGNLDPQLKKLAISIFILVLLFGSGVILQL